MNMQSLGDMFKQAIEELLGNINDTNFLIK
jgi:hypothetical protein